MTAATTGAESIQVPLLQAAKLLASDGGIGDILGNAVAISGDTALVGAVWDDTAAGSDAGSAYVFVRRNGVWVQEQQLLAPDGVAGDKFGVSVALSGNTALVGAYLDDTPVGTDSGAAYVFVRSDGVWALQQKLAPDSGHYFGLSVALSGDTAVVGAPLDDPGGIFNAGAAYVFTRTADAWSQQQKLTPDVALTNYWFGYTVALDGDTALVAAGMRDLSPPLMCCQTGSIHVFKRDGGNWSQQQKITGTNDWFGISLALSGDTALIGQGARLDDANPCCRSGSAWVYVRDSGVWNLQQQLAAPDTTAGDWDGVVVALDHDTALVGARFRDTAAGADAGSVHVFTRGGGVWSQAQVLSPEDAAADDGFAFAVALHDDTAVVGAIGVDTPGGSNAGAAYVFEVPYDHGDAPAPYPTLRDDGGPQHVLGTLRLGALVDAEADGQPEATATGDDLAGSDDDDGVTMGLLKAGVEGRVAATVGGGPAVLDAWLDFNRDGDWDDLGEWILAGAAVADGINQGLTFAVPADAVIGNTYARFRVTAAGIATVGGVAPEGEVEDESVSIIAPDTTPDPFDFGAVTDVDPLATVVSASVTISGIDVAVPVGVVGGEYSIGCSTPFTQTPGSIAPSQTVCVRHTASPAYVVPTETVLTIGGVIGTFRSVTRVRDAVPDSFSFPDITGATPGSLVVSNAMWVSGIADPAPISITGNVGEYSINNGPFTALPGVVDNGDVVVLRQAASAVGSTTLSTTVTIGGVVDTWSVTTAAAPAPDGGGAFGGWPLLLAWPWVRRPFLARRVAGVLG